MLPPCVCVAARRWCLARTYEEAQKLYDKYSNNTLGVISDARFPLKSAAKAFGNEVDARMLSPSIVLILSDVRSVLMPVCSFSVISARTILSCRSILESSESDNRAKAEAEGFRFVDKNSKKMSVDLRHLMEEHMGFGDFIFRDPRPTRRLCASAVAKGVTGQYLQDSQRLDALSHQSQSHEPLALCPCHLPRVGFPAPCHLAEIAGCGCSPTDHLRCHRAVSSHEDMWCGSCLRPYEVRRVCPFCPHW